MTAAALLAAVGALGVRLKATPDGKLFAEPKGKLPPALREKLVAAKPALLAILSAGPTPALPEAPGRGTYADRDRCSGCDAPLGLQGQAVRLAVANTDGTLTCLDCISDETGKRRMRARGVAI